jgi:hypothetical protein
MGIHIPTALTEIEKGMKGEVSNELVMLIRSCCTSTLSLASLVPVATF